MEQNSKRPVKIDDHLTLLWNDNKPKVQSKWAVTLWDVAQAIEEWKEKDPRHPRRSDVLEWFDAYEEENSPKAKPPSIAEAQLLATYVRAIEGMVRYYKRKPFNVLNVDEAKAKEWVRGAVINQPNLPQDVKDYFGIPDE